MDIEFLSAGKASQINWSKVQDGEELAHFFGKTYQQALSQFISNADTKVELVRLDDMVFPITIDSGKNTNKTYVTSLVTQFFDYVQEEILENDKYSKTTKRLARYAFPIIRAIGKRTFSNTVFVNNWLISSNLYPELSAGQWQALAQAVVRQYSGKAIVFKGIVPWTNSQGKHELEKQSFVALVSRQVYIMDPETSKYKKKRPYVMDKKHSDKQAEFYHWEKLEEITDDQACLIKSYYNELYLGKYSTYNPWYTESFIKESCKAGFLAYHVLKKGDQIVAVQAIADQGGVITTPFIGYDQSYPKEEGLYRMMNIMLMDKAIEENKILNMSSGAATFKKQRGGKPDFEYHMVNFESVSGFQKWIWKLMYRYSEKSVKPSMIKYGV